MKHKSVIRNKVFETNSSSTHAICIAPTYKIPDIESVCFDWGEFGWECDVYDYMQARLNYLHEMILSSRDKDKIKTYKEFLRNTLDKYNITMEWSDQKGYIDHGDETHELLELLMMNEKLLLRYLFGNTYIITGNDNDDDFDVVMTQHKKRLADYDIFEKDN